MDSFLKTGKLGVSTKPASTKSGTSGSTSKACIPWVEKYRPKTVDDVVEQAEVVSVLRQSLLGADLPNLLLYGPPGTGKTSTILAASRQLFGDMYRDRILELNASDDRGIQVIREKVKTFAQLSAGPIKKDGTPCPSFKIVILDEADSMTQAAQAALRRTMELYTKSTRFCLVCNYISRIIPPLTSRCTKFRFKSLGKEKILERLKYICKEENVECDDETLIKLVESCGGDLRRAITTLQSCSRLKDKAVTVEDVVEITGVVPNKYIDKMLKVCEDNNYNKIEEFVQELRLEAYSCSQLMEQLQETIINDFRLTDRKKEEMFNKLALCSWRVQDGASEYIQLIDLCCGLAKAYQLEE